MDLTRPKYADNAWNRSKVKESEWPVELFYNKTVNTMKKKEQLHGVNWALEFLIMNEFEDGDTHMDVHYTVMTEGEVPVRREVKLHPNNVNWNHRTRKMVE